MKEGVVEKKLTDLIQKAGGLCVKFTSPSFAGVPDRIIWYHGQSIYVELKAPKQKPRKQQIEIHQKMKRCGIPVYVLDTIPKVQAFVNELIEHNGKIIYPENYTINEKESTHFSLERI